MNSFWTGFEKRALISDKKRELLTGDLLNFVPLGTTLHTVAADRPEGHSRLKEWGQRVGLGLGGSIAGSVLGQVAGRGLGSVGGDPQTSMLLGAILGGLGSIAGSVAGQRIGHESSVEDYYDDKDKLKGKYK